MPRTKNISLDEAYQAYRQFVAAHGYAPTTREFGATLGIVHSAAHHHLRQMEARKLITRDQGKSRGTTLRGDRPAPDTPRAADLVALIAEAADDLDELAEGWVHALDADELAAALRARAAGLRAGLGGARVEA